MILPNLALQPPYAIEGKVWAEHKTELFVATAFENLTADIARGKGGVSGLLGLRCSMFPSNIKSNSLR